MKYFLTLIFASVFIFKQDMYSQAPIGITFQGVLKNANDLSYNSERKLDIKQTILRQDFFTPNKLDIVYQEEHLNVPCAEGLFSIIIGRGNPLSFMIGSFTAISRFNDINWSLGTFFIKTEIKIQPRTNYEDMGTTQFLSVPYSYHSNKSNFADIATSASNAAGWFQLIGGKVYNFSNNIGIGTIPDDKYKLDILGNTNIDGSLTTKTLIIKGGSDIAEKFQSDQLLEPGDIVSIDNYDENKIVKTMKPLDKSIIGVVSGADNINQGIIISQENKLDGKYPIAILGRVKVKVLEDVQPGDFITSSKIPGIGMKAKNKKMSNLAIVGKVLSYRDKNGMVLILLN